MALGISLHFIYRLAVLGFMATVYLAAADAFLRGNIRRLILCVILSWGLEPFSPVPNFVFYTDSQGIRNGFGVTSALLAVAFVALMLVDSAFVARFFRTPIFLAFYVLFACAALTQMWYLGFLPGLGLTYDRVLQPMMVVVLLAYLARDGEKVRSVYLCLVGAVTTAIVLRYAAGVALGGGVMSTTVSNAAGIPRVSAIGSWTIYGTICASMIPIVIALLATERVSLNRVVLIVVTLLLVKEVMATGTRGAIVGFSAVLLFSIRRRARRWMLACVAIALVAALALNYHAAFSGSRTLSLNINALLNQPNTQVRFERNLAAVHYISAHPFSGSALGVSHWVQGQEIGTWVYNPYLAWGAAMGLPALLAFAAIVVLTIAYTVGNWRASSGSYKTLQVGVAAALVVWLINQFTTGDSLTYLQSVNASFFFYALVGIALGSHMNRFQPQPATQRRGA